jgi:hypothetical protein
MLVRVARRATMYAFAVCMLLGFADAPKPDSARVERLIAQLGSPLFQERQAATKSLEGIGPSTLNALRRAAAESRDAEVSLRAKRLVRVLEQSPAERMVLAIITSDLNPEEKGQRLQRLIGPGRNREEVHQFLGNPDSVLRRIGDVSADGTIERKGRSLYYVRYGLTVDCDKDGKVEASVADPPSTDGKARSVRWSLCDLARFVIPWRRAEEDAGK